MLEGGGEVLERTRVLDIDRSEALIRVVSERGVLLAERVVIATGPWLPELVAAIAAAVAVVPRDGGVRPAGRVRLDRPELGSLRR